MSLQPLQEKGHHEGFADAQDWVRCGSALVTLPGATAQLGESESRPWPPALSDQGLPPPGHGHDADVRRCSWCEGLGL